MDDTLLQTLAVVCIIGVLTIGIIAAAWWTIQQGSKMASDGINPSDVQQLLADSTCPYCRSRVAHNAPHCPYCGGTLDKTDASVTATDAGFVGSDNAAIIEEFAKQDIPGGTRIQRTVRVIRKNNE